MLRVPLESLLSQEVIESTDPLSLLNLQWELDWFWHLPTRLQQDLQIYSPWEPRAGGVGGISDGLHNDNTRK